MPSPNYQTTDAYNELIDHLKMMLSEDEQSVAQQILTLSDNHLVFQMINFCRGLEGSSSKNRELANFIDQGYACFQVMGIRGLSDDEQTNSLSLINALNHLRKSKEHITRQNYVCHNSYSYFYEEEEKQFLKEQQKYAEENPGSLKVHTAGNWSEIKRRHQQFDKLSSTANACDRTSDDLMNDEILSMLYKKLKECHGIGRFYANTKVAHKQNEEGRRILEDREIKLTIDEISRCHQILWSVFNTITCYILQDNHQPTYSKFYNRFDFLSEPWVRPEFETQYKDELNNRLNEMEKTLKNLLI